MRQKKLVRKLYQAAIEHNDHLTQALRREEFAKIFRRRAKNKPFTTQWIVVAV